MKEKGYKHEDELMKENAKLQVQKGHGIMNAKNRNESVNEDSWLIFHYPEANIIQVCVGSEINVPSSRTIGCTGCLICS